MGGAFPGQFPPALRIAALIQAALLLGMALSVLARMVASITSARVVRRSFCGIESRPQSDHTKRR